MGIAGTNREGMRKYQRFVENLKESSDRGGALGVRNARFGQFFAPSPAVSIGHLGDMVSTFKTAPSPSRHAMTGLFR